MNYWIKALTTYGINQKLIEPEDEIYARNRILEIMQISEYKDCEVTESHTLSEILDALTKNASERRLLDYESVTERDLFDTKLMGALTPFPSTVNQKFRALYQENPKLATDYYYALSQSTNYIRTDRIAKDIRWQTTTEFGTLDITINLSKPEKDPKAIAAARLASPTSYPKCLLCIENEGYAGGMQHPARQNHRLISMNLEGEPWSLQYSPYVYYNEHCILLNQKHTPMTICKETFSKLLAFVEQFPHYFIGSNADLPIVGGSILSHEHFQGGCYTFPMEKAPILKSIRFAGFEEVEAGIVKWYLSCIRLRHEDASVLVNLADHILQRWRGYSDAEAGIYAETMGEPHNTITPIARKKDGKFELDLVLRNNLTTEEHPLGVFHPHAELHHIKKENIGLIEVMGLAVLPARLKQEMEAVIDCLYLNKTLDQSPLTLPHWYWAEAFRYRCEGCSREEVQRVVQYEIGQVFAKVLEHAGVYKQTAKGIEAFQRFLLDCGMMNHTGGLR